VSVDLLLPLRKNLVPGRSILFLPGLSVSTIANTAAPWLETSGRSRAMKPWMVITGTGEREFHRSAIERDIS